jgi:hypothetical protein
MRHLYGLGFGLVIAPVTWFLASLGHFRILDGAAKLADGGGSAASHLAFGAVLIVAAGAWLGVLLSSRLSPLAPGITGLIWLGLGVGYIAKGEAFLAKLPDGPSGQEGLFGLPLEHGYAFLIGTALMSPLFSPARWRSAPSASLADEAPAAETSRDYATDSYPARSHSTGSHATVGQAAGGHATGGHPTVRHGTGSHATVAEPEPTAQRRSRAARPMAAVPDLPPDERRSATGSYRAVQHTDPVPQASDAQRLSSWNEDGTGQHAVIRHRTRGY